MPGNISGLANTNVLNTQLDSGQIEMTTIAGAVQDSGAIDVTLEERDQDQQDGGDSTDMEDGNCYNPRLKPGERKTVTNVGAVNNCEAIDVPFEDGKQCKVDSVKVREGIIDITRCTIIKCHQETQTELSVHLFISDVGEQEQRKETGL